MQSHRDDDSPKVPDELLGLKRQNLTPEDERQEFMAELQARAERMKERGESKIAAGDGPLEQWARAGVMVRKLPDDQQGILRISIGGGSTPIQMDYCSFRGDREECVSLLQRALAALADD